MPHTYTNSLYHIVFSTKDRYPFITKDTKSRLYEYMGGTIRGLSGVCIEIGGIDEHVHLLVKLKPTMNVSNFLRDLKPSVTKWARENIHSKFEWQKGYGAFTVSESQFEKVRHYIQNQESRHRKMSFDQEFEMLLRKCRIEYDRKYLWK